MCGDHDLAFTRVDRDVAYLDVWQIQRQWLPVRCTVEAYENSALCREKEQIRCIRILANSVKVLVGGKAGAQRRPRLAEVRRFVDEWMEVVILIPRGG